MSIDHKHALELAREGKWDEAHRLVQQASDRSSCLIHAYLHRAEGDMDNASYWYQRAGEEMPENSLQTEWQRLYGMMEADS